MASTKLPSHPVSRPALRSAEHGFTVLRDVMVEMRDGVKLASDVWLPAKDGNVLSGPFPVVLERTPYNKERWPNNCPTGEFWAARGYVHVNQDTRGRFHSEGEFVSYPSEGDDGVDTVKWIMEESWCSGQICVTGSSYFASTAQAILCRNVPGVVAAVIRVGAGDYHEDGAYYGGAKQICHNVNYALSLAATSPEAQRDPEVKKAFEEASTTANALELMRNTPIKPGTLFAKSPPSDAWYDDWQTHELYDEFWKRDAYRFDYQAASDVPVLLIATWYDAFLGGMLDAFPGYAMGKKSPVHMVTGGGHHSSVYTLSTVAGDVDHGTDMPMDVPALICNWFDHHVKGIDNGFENKNVFHALRMEGGSGTKTAAGNLEISSTWQTFTSWPPADVSQVPFYLGPDGSLAKSQPQTTGSISFDYDPRDPVPTIGGNVSSGNQVVLAGPYNQKGSSNLLQCKDTLPLAERPDVLCFRTPTLTEDVEVTGPLHAVLFVSSSAVDTDFTAKLVDEYPASEAYPNGYAMNVVDGIVRARLRSFTKAGPTFRRIYGHKEEPLTPGQVYKVEIELWATSMLFRKGHKIRLDVSSSNFPRFDINPNTGEKLAERSGRTIVARNAVYWGEGQSSFISLPIRSGV